MTNSRANHLRADLALIYELIPPGSRVLDLGCGDGELLHQLILQKGVQGYGVEIDEQAIYSCIEKGVPVLHSDIDEGMSDYPDRAFDYVILSQTLQEVRHPLTTLREMLRVGRTGLISLINFGYWKVRAQLFFTGKMPRTRTLPYQWYDTHNIHLATIRDFRNLCASERISISRRIFLSPSRRRSVLARLSANLFADLAIFILQCDTAR